MTISNLMPDQKTMTVAALSLAVVVAAIAAIVVSVNRADAAKAYAEEAAAEADRASATNKIAQAYKEAKRAEEHAAEANAQSRKDELEKQRLAKETAEIEAKAAADKKAAAEANAAAERDVADGRRAIREAARMTNETARIELQKAKALAAAEQEKAAAAERSLAAEKLKADKIIAEAKALELRKTDFETLERDLLEWKLNLEERERALKPEKTIADLEWAGGMEDTIIDDKGNVRKQVKTVYDPERDMSLPEQSRNLARAERKVREAQDATEAETRAAILESMEKLYVDALKENRVIDADFYKKSIRVMYPDWKFKAP